MEGRGGEFLGLVSELARDTTLVHANVGDIGTVEALLAAEAGADHQGAPVPTVVLANDLESLPETSVWLPALFGVAEAAAKLGDVPAAHEAETWLETYASLPIMGSLAIVCFGSANRCWARTLGRVVDFDGAVASLEEAILHNRRLGHLPMLAITAPISRRPCMRVTWKAMLRARMKCSILHSLTVAPWVSTHVSHNGRRYGMGAPEPAGLGASQIVRSRCSAWWRQA